MAVLGGAHSDAWVPGEEPDAVMMRGYGSVRPGEGLTTTAHGGACADGLGDGNLRPVHSMRGQSRALLRPGRHHLGYGRLRRVMGQGRYARFPVLGVVRE